MKSIPFLFLLCVAGLASAACGMCPVRVANAHPVFSSGSFSPDSIDGLQFWFKGDTLTALSTEGGSISNWPNSVVGKEAWFATNATAAQWPKLTNTFNGLARSALTFTAAEQLNVVSTAAKNVTRNTNDCSIVSVVNMKGSGLNKVIFSISTSATFDQREQMSFSGVNYIELRQRSLDSESATMLFTPVSMPQNVATCYQGDFTHTNKTAVTGSAMAIYSNNVVSATGTGSTSTNTVDTASALVEIGARNSGVRFNGDLAEILVYVPKLSPADRTNVWLYLQSKYSL